MLSACSPHLGACAVHGDDAAVCAPDGACVGCASEADCAAGNACDALEAICRPCEINSDCEGGVCRPEGCVSPGEIVQVSPEGVDRPGCSQAEPCATLTFALGFLAEGRPYLHVAAGRYTENLELADLHARIVSEPGAELRGALGDRPVLRVTSGEIAIEGLVVIGAASGAADAVEVAGGVLDLRDVEVRDARLTGVLIAGGELRMAGGGVRGSANHGVKLDRGRAQLDGAELRDNAAAGVFAIRGELAVHAAVIADNRGSGVVARDTQVEILNSFVHGNSGTMFAPVHFGTTTATRSVRVAHTTVVDNLSGGDSASGVACDGSYQATLRNNVIHGNQGPDIPVAGCAITYSLLGPAIVAGVGNVLGTPRFVDREGGDLHLVPDSVGVDDGTSGDADVDFDGDPRPSGGAPDMGADEVPASTRHLCDLGAGCDAKGGTP